MVPAPCVWNADIENANGCDGPATSSPGCNIGAAAVAETMLMNPVGSGHVKNVHSVLLAEPCAGIR